MPWPRDTQLVDDATPQVVWAAATLTALRIVGAPRIALGEQAQLRAIGAFSDGSTRDLTASVAWAIAFDALIAEVAPHGVVTAMAPGATTIRARDAATGATAVMTLAVTR